MLTKIMLTNHLPDRFADLLQKQRNYIFEIIYLQYSRIAEELQLLQIQTYKQRGHRAKNKNHLRTNKCFLCQNNDMVNMGQLNMFGK